MTSSIYPPGLGQPAVPQPPAHSQRAWLEVDLGAIRRNAERLQRAARVPIVAMIKADAYGLGALAVARALQHMGSALWGFGVSTLAEADELRTAGFDARILCCTPLLARELSYANRLGVIPALHRIDDINEWATLGGGAWHLSIDTGMSRAGIRWDDVSTLVSGLRRHAPEGVFTHFHSAEISSDSRVGQEQRLRDALTVLRDSLPANVLVHSDNSAGIAARTCADSASPGALARPGIGLYGAFVAETLALEQVVHLRARVVDVRDVHAGETVGYGAGFTAAATCRIATVSAGHGDGYRRALSNRGEALLHARRVAVAGVVSMDMTMLDVTGVRCDVGDIVTLIGRDGSECLTTDAVALAGALSPYELLVGLRLRLPRVYSGEV